MLAQSSSCSTPAPTMLSEIINMNSAEEKNNHRHQQSLIKQHDLVSRKGIWHCGWNIMSAAVVLISFCTVTPVAAANDSGRVVSWTILHSWNPQQDFVKRGMIAWNKENNVAVESSNNDDNEASAILDIRNDQTLTVHEITEMLNYGWYHVKLVPDLNPEDSIMGTVPACHVLRANFKDIFEITLPRSNLKEDHILSFAYTPLVSPLAPKSCDEYPSLEENVTMSFQSKTSVKLDTPGMLLKPILTPSKPPPGLTFLKRPRDTATAGSSKKKDGDGDLDYDDRESKPEPPSGFFGFFHRYWYLIVPMLVMQFLAPPPEDPQQQQQGGRGQQQQVQQQGAAIAPPPGAMAATGGGTKKSARRGKRN
jgi:hypothetical protein